MSDSSSSEFELVELQKQVDLANTTESRKSTRGSRKTLPFIQSPRLADLDGRGAFYTIFKDDMNLLKESRKSPEIPTQNDATVPKVKTIGKEKGEGQENVEEVSESIHCEECASSIKKNSADDYKTEGFKTVLPSVKVKNDETFPKIRLPSGRCCDRNGVGKPPQQQVNNRTPNAEDAGNTPKPPNANYFIPIAVNKVIPETDELNFENLICYSESDTFSQTSDPRSIFTITDSDDRNSLEYEAGDNMSFLNRNAATNSTVRLKFDKNCNYNKIDCSEATNYKFPKISLPRDSSGEKVAIHVPESFADCTDFNLLPPVYGCFNQQNISSNTAPEYRRFPYKENTGYNTKSRYFGSRQEEWANGCFPPSNIPIAASQFPTVNNDSFHSNMHPGCVTPNAPLHQNIAYIRYPPDIMPVLDSTGSNTLPIYTASSSNMAPDDISRPQKFGNTYSPFQYPAYPPLNPCPLFLKNLCTDFHGIQPLYNWHEQLNCLKSKSTADELNDVLTGQSPKLNAGAQRVNESDSVNKDSPQRTPFANYETRGFLQSGSKSDVTSVDKNSSAETRFTACESQKNISAPSRRKVTSPLSLAESLVAEDPQKNPCTPNAVDHCLSDVSEEALNLVTSKNYSKDCQPKIKPHSSCASQNVIYFPKVFKRDSFETLPKHHEKKIDLFLAASINKMEDDVHSSNTLKLSDDKVTTSTTKKSLVSASLENGDPNRKSAFCVDKKNGANSNGHSSKAVDPPDGSKFSTGTGREIKFFNDRCCSPVQPQDQKNKIAPLMTHSIRLEETVPGKVASNLQKISASEKNNPDEGFESIQLENEMNSSENTDTHFRNFQTETHVFPKITVKITSKNLCVDIYRLDISQSQDMQGLEISISDAAASEREPGTIVYFPNTNNRRMQRDSPIFNSREDDGKRSSTYKPDDAKPIVHSLDAKSGKAFDNYEFYNVSPSKSVKREANGNPTEVRDRSKGVSICSWEKENEEVSQGNDFKFENLEPQPPPEIQDLFGYSGIQYADSMIAHPTSKKTINTEVAQSFPLKAYAEDKEMEREGEWYTLPRNKTIHDLPRPMRSQYSETKQKFVLRDEDPLHCKNLTSKSAAAEELKRWWLNFGEKGNCDSHTLADLKTERKMDKNFERHFISNSSGPRKPAYRKFTDHRQYDSYVPTDLSFLLPSENHMERGIPRNPIKGDRRNKFGTSFYDNSDSGYRNAWREMYRNQKKSLETMLPYIHGINDNSLVQTNTRKYGNFYDSKCRSQRTERQQNQVKTARCFGRGWTNPTLRNQKNLSYLNPTYGIDKFRDSFFGTPASNGGDMFSAQPGNMRSYPFTRPSFFSPFNDDKVLYAPPNYSYNRRQTWRN